MISDEMLKAVEANYKDWKKLKKRGSFGTFHAVRMTRGFAFLGTKPDDHERNLKRYREEAEAWAKSQNLPM